MDDGFTTFDESMTVRDVLSSSYGDHAAEAMIQSASAPSAIRQSPGFGRLAEIGMGRENLVWASLDKLSEDTWKPRPVAGYSPFNEEDLVGYEDLWWLFTDSQSPAETSLIKAQVDKRREEDMMMSAAGGVSSFAAYTLAAVTSPENFVPLGVVAKPFQALRMTKALTLPGAGAAVGGVSAGLAEVGLQAIDPFRTAEESALNVAAGLTLGGLLGVGPGLKAKYVENMELLLDLKNETVDSVMEKASKEGVFDLSPEAQVKRVNEIFQDADPRYGKLLYFNNALGKVLRFSPWGRLSTSESQSARLFSSVFMDNPSTKVDGSGRPIALQTLESEMNYKYLTTSKAQYDIEGVYRSYKKDGGTLDEKTFMREVSMASRRRYEPRKDKITWLGEELPPVSGEKDVNAIREAAQRYKMWAEPLTEESKEVGLFTYLDLFSTDSTWVTRTWDIREVRARRGEFKERLVNWYKEYNVYPEGSDLDAIAEDTIRGIEKQPSGHTQIRSEGGLGRAERDRALLIPTYMVEDFVENDIRKNMWNASRSIAPDQVLARTVALNNPRLNSDLLDLTSARLKKFAKDGDVRHIDLVHEYSYSAEVSAELRSRVAKKQSKNQVRVYDGDGRSVLKEVSDIELADMIDAQADEIVRKFDLSLKNNQKSLDLGSGKLSTVAEDDLSIHRARMSALIKTAAGSGVGPSKSATAQSSRGRLEIFDMFKGERIPLEDGDLLEAGFRQLKEHVQAVRRRNAVRGLDATQWRNAVRDEYVELMDAAKTEKQRYKLAKQRDKDIRAIQLTVDRLRNNDGIPNNPDWFFTKAEKWVRQINFQRYMGGVTLSSFADVAMPVFVNGFSPTMKSFRRYIRSAIKGLPEDELKLLIQTLEYSNASFTRAHIYGGLEDIFASSSKFEEVLEKTTNGFARATMINHWNGFAKGWASLGIQDRILRDAADLVDGKISPTSKAARKLAGAGIDEDSARMIIKEFRKRNGFGGEIDEGLRLSRSDRWENRDAARVFDLAVLRDTNRTILTPGAGDLPAFMTTPYLRVLGQFKSFAFAATNNILIPGLQTRDAAAIGGFGLSVMAGAMVYALKARLRGDDPFEKNAAQWVVEGVDRSGMLGLIPEIAGFGMRAGEAMFGFESSSRFSGRALTGIALGPTASTLEDTGDLIGVMSEGRDFTPDEREKFSKFVPWAGLFYVQYLLRQVGAFGESRGD